MNLEAMLIPFLWGLLVGGICVGGLQAGLKILLKTQSDESESKDKKRRNYLFASVILVGQLLAALGILFKSNAASQSPIGLAGGIVVAIFVFALVGKQNE